MQIYIDESGNLGKGMGRFFVIACLIPQKNIPRRIKRIFRNNCIKFGKPNQPLDEIKACNLGFVQKQGIINQICSRDDFTVSYIVADKSHINQMLLVDKNICYNYLVSHLLKRILKGTTEDIQVILDNHSTKVSSINSLTDYIKILAYTKWGYRGTITFEYRDSKSHYVLQAVDLLANVVFGKYHHSKEHFFSLLQTFFKYKIEFPYQKFNMSPKAILLQENE